MTNWTDGLIEQLTALWNTGEYSCLQIAAQLGHGISRNAVIGKALRLGLEKKIYSKRHKAKLAKRVFVERKPARPARAPVAPPPDHHEDLTSGITSLAQLEAEPIPELFLGIPLLKLQDQHCRYPRIIEGQTLFCGQPKMFTIESDGTSTRSSYCEACHKRCHTGGFGRASHYVWLPSRRAA